MQIAVCCIVIAYIDDIMADKCFGMRFELYNVRGKKNPENRNRFN